MAGDIDRHFDRLARAREFAIDRHGEQRYGNDPYSRHLLDVTLVLDSFGYLCGNIAAAAWLHDTVEDTGTTCAEIADEFGADVASLVWAVTGVGHNRKTRNADAYAKIQAYPLAAILKLADRIANVEASADVPGKLAMYRNEYPEFRRALDGLGSEPMWQRLERALGITPARSSA